jgi:hypothetical protein
MPFHARGRRALLVLAALGAGLVAASPAVAVPLDPVISGGPTVGQHVRGDAVPAFTVTPSDANPVDWCYSQGGAVSGPQAATSCGAGTTKSLLGSATDGTWRIVAEAGPDATDPVTPYAAASSDTFVVDNTGPSSPLPGPQTLDATSPAGRSVQYAPLAFDSGDNAAVTVSCNPSAGTPHTFPIGTTTVSCTASDSLGNTTAGSFTVTIADLSNPSVPVPSSPAPNAFLTTGTPTLTWAASTDAVGVDHYVVQVDALAPASVPASATSYTTPPLASGGHTWSVEAFDAAGHGSGFSASQPFSIGVPPAAPVVTGPPALSNVALPTFSWTGEPGGAFVWAVFKGTTKVRGNTILTPLTATTVTLQNALGDGDYTFQVTQINSFGAGPASVPWPFTVDTTAPKLVTSGSPSIAPEPGATDVGTLSAIEVIFSEPVAPLTGANLRLCVGLCGSPVDAVVTSNGAKSTLTPSAALRGTTSYQVDLSGVTDLAGNALQLPSGTWTWTFRTAQAVAPPDPITGLTLTPGVAQIGLDWVLPTNGGLGKIRVVRRDGTAPTGPADPAAVAFDLAPTANSYVDATATPKVHYFYALYSYDAFGNPSATAASGDATALAPPEPPVLPPVIPPITPPIVKPGVNPVIKGLLNTKRLTPVKGTTLRSLRPLLKWKGIGKRAKLYNLQIFQGKRKVLSVFPRGTTYRVPKGKLKAGKTYVWRVWPYLGKKYAKGPVGVSYFVTASKIQAEVPAATAVTR